MTTPNGPLPNLLGTGVIPADEEQELIACGTKFAAYWTGVSGRDILIFSRHENIHKRWAEQMQTMYDEEHGLPVQYRIPARDRVPPG